MAMPCSIAARLAATPAAKPSRSAARATAIPPGSVSQNCADGATRAPTKETVATCARPSSSGDGAGLRDVLVGVIAGAHERPRGHVLEAELVAGALERGELGRGPVADDGEVAPARGQGRD